jgi:hypothetical protein
LKHLGEAESSLQKSATSVGIAALVFVRLKIYLDLGEADAAIAQVNEACKCADFSPCFLEVNFTYGHVKPVQQNFKREIYDSFDM